MPFKVRTNETKTKLKYNFRSITKLHTFLLSHFADWQSYVFFHQIWKSGQSGEVTRVASGCDDDDNTAIQLKQIFQEQIQSLPTGERRFHLHLTPDYSSIIPGVTYNFFNKPMGLLHWMEHGLGLPKTMEQFRNTIFIILDPDQFLLRPFQPDFSNDTTIDWHSPPNGETDFRVRQGRPFSQKYGLGAAWMRSIDRGISTVVDAARKAMGSNMDPNNKSSSYLYKWTQQDIAQHYVAGPPYIAMGSDMYKIVKTWAAVVLPVYDLTKDHLSEMFAYATAAAHLELPHQLANSFMVSSPYISKEEEGWKIIDMASPEQICKHVRRDDNDPENLAWTNKLPQVLHYCQRYFLGPHFFSKYKLPKQFLSCSHPLIVDPLEDDAKGAIASKYDSSVTPNHQFNEISPIHRKRHAFFLCHIIPKINDAATYWKQRHCVDANPPANFSRVFVFPMDQK
jgi:hypothetical protein